MKWRTWRIRDKAIGFFYLRFNKCFGMFFWCLFLSPFRFLPLLFEFLFRFFLLESELPWDVSLSASVASFCFWWRFFALAWMFLWRLEEFLVNLLGGGSWNFTFGCLGGGDTDGSNSIVSVPELEFGTSSFDSRVDFSRSNSCSDFFRWARSVLRSSSKAARRKYISSSESSLSCSYWTNFLCSLESKLASIVFSEVGGCAELN